MDNQPTCGKGLAGNAAVPAQLGELTAAMAGVLEAHMVALDLTDPASRKENEVYAELAARQRESASQLKETADRMAGYRDLPMGRHDQHLMGGARMRQAFERFLGAERELLQLLQERLERDQELLGRMPGT